MVARSSAEAKYQGMAATAAEVLWLRGLLVEIGVQYREPVTLYCDSKEAIQIAVNSVYHEKTKIIEIDCHFIREKIQEDLLKTEHVPTGEQLADIVTKAISVQQHSYLLFKVLNLQNLEGIKSFVVEYEALRKIRHGTLVKVITSCLSVDYQGNYFKAIVLEFMANGSLEKWLNRDFSCHLSFGQVLDIAIDVANALDYLHHHCETVIVHRDLKPTNVLLDDDMVACVSDFGMAKTPFDAASKLGFEQATSFVINGTIGYVARKLQTFSSHFISSSKNTAWVVRCLQKEMITGKKQSDDLFNDGSSLHDFCKTALTSSEKVKKVTDSRLLHEINDQQKKTIIGDDVIWECLVALINSELHVLFKFQLRE
ncbi:probable LRR receptor-like serine/threonine-protein kinase At3g47570 [Hibiscus syriacus]|uniref:probable LRR receptor-like serine/threonine-protein kinase At3g47570 n=1 Tax=Hibiscus syriacus TaxID=106335 RepID=UPI0019249E3E|nr:probable LRR receptor-like serine/threonine-protein kinase At3g47570 [Hibiscus syriacus]